MGGNADPTPEHGTLYPYIAIMTQSPEREAWREETSKRLKAWCHKAGFELAGIAPVAPGLGGDRLREWLAEGKHGEMEYMARHAEARLDPNLVLPGVKSVLVVGLGYRTVEPNKPGAGEGRISRYAWGEDYHKVIRRKLQVVVQYLREHAPEVRSRIVVDSAPVMERDYARLAGLGWFGKNTLLLNRRLGSWFFLGALLLDVDVETDQPFEADHCGSCRRCLDACPTGAFDGPYQLDPRRCISYLTIEHKSEMSPDLADKLGEWVYGCDVCQEVCPWNHRAARDENRPNEEFRPKTGMDPITLDALLEMTPGSFQQRFSNTAIERIGVTRLSRNARLASGRPAAETEHGATPSGEIS